MVRVEIEYQGNLHCEAVHGPSQGRITTDAPVDNHGRGEAFSPTDLVGAALGTCMATIMGIVAQRHAIELKGMRIQVDKEMVTSPVRRIGRLVTRITIPLPKDHPQRALLEQAALTCPVHASLHPDVEKPIEFVWGQ
ncbi:MAG: OsmC family protein [Verrucomicrobiota bacterium]